MLVKNKATIYKYEYLMMLLYFKYVNVIIQRS